MFGVLFPIRKGKREREALQSAFDSTKLNSPAIFHSHAAEGKLFMKDGGERSKSVGFPGFVGKLLLFQNIALPVNTQQREREREFMRSNRFISFFHRSNLPHNTYFGLMNIYHM